MQPLHCEDFTSFVPAAVACCFYESVSHGRTYHRIALCRAASCCLALLCLLLHTSAVCVVALSHTQVEKTPGSR